MDNKVIRRFIFIIISACYVFFGQASAQQAITTPILPTLQNFRDVAGISASNGGTGFVNPIANNGVMRTGIFYRSNALSVNNDPQYPNLIKMI